MVLGLNNLKYKKGSQRRQRRLGRGHGSGRGTYAGRGGRGQKARTGGKKGLKLKGMRTRLLKIPKVRGFKSLYAKPAVINLADINIKFKTGDIITPQKLFETGLIDTIKNGVKILGKGELEKALTISGCAISKSAEEKIKAAGGKIEKS